jgi:hypothetical protein
LELVLAPLHLPSALQSALLSNLRHRNWSSALHRKTRRRGEREIMREKPYAVPSLQATVRLAPPPAVAQEATTPWTVSFFGYRDHRADFAVGCAAVRRGSSLLGIGLRQGAPATEVIAEGPEGDNAGVMLLVPMSSPPSPSPGTTITEQVFLH